MRFMAAASSALRPVLAGPARPAELLGATPAALYLRTEHLRTEHMRTGDQPGVLAVLTQDAMRLPCGLVLGATSAELSLASLAPDARPGLIGPRLIGPCLIGPCLIGPCLVGDGAVTWTGPTGPVAVRAVREWTPIRPPRGGVVAEVLAVVRAALSGVDPEVDSMLLADAAAAAGEQVATAAARLLGRGPGLTPSGDDLLAGFLVGASAFGVDTAALRAATALLAPARTTALSAALLWHARRGECIEQLAAVAAVIGGHGLPEQAGAALGRLLAVGHTTGRALALGLAAAAERALSSAAAGHGVAGTAA